MDINYFTKEIYIQLLNEPSELNERTGISVHALPGITFQTDLEEEGFPLLSLRKIPFSFVPEIIWFMSGSNDATWLSEHTKIWDQFKEENGTISSAYGHRWRHHFGVDQLEIVLKKLSVDPSSRHGVVLMWSPKEDLLIKQKNVPCPVMMTLNIINYRLHLHLIIRSNDMVLGFPTDVAGFALLTHILAQALEVKPGILTVSISNAHIYENQVEAVKEMINREPHFDNIEFTLPEYLETNLSHDELVAKIKESFTNYKPHEAIKNIPIAL